MNIVFSFHHMKNRNNINKRKYKIYICTMLTRGNIKDWNNIGKMKRTISDSTVLFTAFHNENIDIARNWNWIFLSEMLILHSQYTLIVQTNRHFWCVCGLLGAVLVVKVWQQQGPAVLLLQTLWVQQPVPEGAPQCCESVLQGVWVVLFHGSYSLAIILLSSTTFKSF